MPRIFEKKKDYKVKKGDTLTKIAERECPDLEWKDLALFNCASIDPHAVNRWLLESVGVETFDPKRPQKTLLAPEGTKKIAVPKLWTKKSLKAEKTHKIKVRKRLPATAIRIEKLDKWFIPGKESCDIKYSLEGAKACAQKVRLEVFGSNYCDAGAWNKGLATFPSEADKKDVALYEKDEQTDAPANAQNVAAAEWKGIVTATEGALGTKTPKPEGGDEDRVINVAFSPYTVVLKYYKDDADKAARILLGPFWPHFDQDGAPEPGSMKVQWGVDTGRFGGGKGGGTLLIVDNKDEIVFRQGLKPALLEKKTNGFHEVDWKHHGKVGGYNEAKKQNSKGGVVAIPEDMPYRVQVQMHTGLDEENGLGLAAMHTEVRLYLAPETLSPDKDPYEIDKDKDSLILSCGPDLLKTREWKKADGTPWIKYELAKSGFHPGPIDDDAGKEPYKQALLEFKRSVPKKKTGTDFERLALDGSEGNDVKEALEELASQAARQRPWFGDPDNQRSDLRDLTSSAFKDRFRNPKKDLIVWVDDRHFYTDPNWLSSADNPKGGDIRNELINHQVALGNYGKTYASTGDEVVETKKKAIPRPWIAVGVDLPLLSKQNKLSDTLAVPSDDDLKQMRKATGPLRVDWTFDEIDAAPPVVDVLDASVYGKEVTRTKAYVEAILDKMKASHDRKDIKKTCQYVNCPENNGGVRPSKSKLADYQKAVFGHADDSLKPFRAEADPTYETVASVAHDNLGQAAEDLVYTCIGRSGVYFRPSTIGGDGYQLRAQVRFEKLSDYELPNLDVLKDRYPLLPQAHSARMRVWRKASIRGYICWSDQNNWGAFKDSFLKYYTAAHLHFVKENGDGNVAGTITDYLSDDAAFKTLVKKALVSGGASAEETARAKNENIKLVSDRLWPWASIDQFGIFEPGDPGGTKSEAMSKFLKKVMNPRFFNLTNIWGIEWVNKIEKSTGRFRGHIVVEFKCSDGFWLQEYKCENAGHRFYFLEHSEAGNHKYDKECASPACTDKLKQTDPKWYGEYTCDGPDNHEFKYIWVEASDTGGSYHDFNCTKSACGGKLKAARKTRQKYRCKKDHKFALVEDGSGDSHVGETCPAANCFEKLFRDGQWKGRYRCGACGDTKQFNEPDNQGGTHAGRTHDSCPEATKGTYQRYSDPDMIKPDKDSAEGWKVKPFHAEPHGYRDNVIPVPSVGNPLGVSLNSDARDSLWGHELGHNRHLTHAASAPGAENAHHDHQDNTGFNWAGIGETDDKSQKWDRACLMSYVGHQDSHDPARDIMFPCGKCVLKIRGWKIEGIPDGDVAAGVSDP